MNDQNDSVKERLVSLPVAIDKPVTFAFITVGSRRDVRARVCATVDGAIRHSDAIWNCVDDEVEKP